MFKTLVTHGILQNNGQHMWDSITVAHGIVQNNGWYIYANIYCYNPKMMVFYNSKPMVNIFMKIFNIFYYYALNYIYDTILIYSNK